MEDARVVVVEEEVVVAIPGGGRRFGGLSCLFALGSRVVLLGLGGGGGVLSV